jgi:hypothetical protein
MSLIRVCLVVEIFEPTGSVSWLFMAGFWEFQGASRIAASLGQPLGDGDLAWVLIAQCVWALVVARMLAREETQRDVLDANCKKLHEALAPVVIKTASTQDVP